LGSQAAIFVLDDLDFEVFALFEAFGTDFYPGTVSELGPL
jgi:hypothetical protein